MVTEVFATCPRAPWALVSDRGRVLTNRRGRAKTPGPYREVGRVDSVGYRVVSFRETGPMRVHRLVALAFHGAAPDGKSVVRHLNGNKLDNRAANLAWGTHAENVADMLRLGEIKTGHKSPNWKTHCIQGHEMSGDNLYLPPSGGRQCRACKNARSLRRYYELMAAGIHPRQLAVGGKDSDLYPTPWEITTKLPDHSA